jgi:hypothetical protein
MVDDKTKEYSEHYGGSQSQQNQGMGQHQFMEQMEKMKRDTEARIREMAMAQTKQIELHRAEAEAAKEQAAKAQASTRILEVRLYETKGRKPKVISGLFHEKFDKLVALAKARKNIFIYGPTGSGKTFVCQQIADSLGLDFSFISCTGGMTEGSLGGKLLPMGANGKFIWVPAEFVERYEKGGLFLFDEWDAADANTNLFTNTALSGDKMYLPNRPAKPYAVKHPDFVCVAAANTVGTGADRQYTGRHKLDASSLDRFQIGKVYLGYDDRVEEALCPNDELRGKLWCYRAAVMDHALERAISTRFMQDACDMITNHGWTWGMVEEALFTGWREDEINRVRNYYQQNKHKFVKKTVDPATGNITITGLEKVRGTAVEFDGGPVPF